MSRAADDAMVASHMAAPALFASFIMFDRIGRPFRFRQTMNADSRLFDDDEDYRTAKIYDGV